MSYSVNATFSSSQAKLEGEFPLDMYAINASLTGWDLLYYANVNQDVYGFEIDSNKNITSATVLYTGLPIGRGSVKTTLDEQIPGLDITVPNVDRVIESYIQAYNYLRGQEVIAMTTFAKYLPTGNSAYYIGETPDPAAVMTDKLYVDGTSSSEETVTFTCKSKFVIKNVVLPNRKYSRECSWEYGGNECDPTVAIDYDTYPTCDYTLTSCRARNNDSRYGGFPGIPKRGIYVA